MKNKQVSVHAMDIPKKKEEAANLLREHLQITKNVTTPTWIEHDQIESLLYQGDNGFPGASTKAEKALLKQAKKLKKWMSKKGVDVILFP